MLSTAPRVVKKLNRSESLDAVVGYTPLAIGVSADGRFASPIDLSLRRFRRRTFGAQKTRWTRTVSRNSPFVTMRNLHALRNFRFVRVFLPHGFEHLIVVVLKT